MIKRTLYFGNPSYLKTTNEQMVISMTDSGEVKEVPIEDIGLLILDHQQITITQALIAKLLANNVAVITCDHTHHPTGMLLNLDGHTLQSQRFKAQIDATIPLKKQLWQQTVMAKIANQAALLKRESTEYKLLNNYARNVKTAIAKITKPKRLLTTGSAFSPASSSSAATAKGRRPTTCSTMAMPY